jgi:hypothetical protein
MAGRRLLACALLSAALAGCGSSAIDKLPERITAATSHGLRYTLLISYEGGKQCTTATYAATPPRSAPIRQTSRRCDKPAVSGHPTLIQAHGSAESLVVDVPADGCGRVRAGPRTGALHRLSSHCTTPTPDFRVTVLPAARRLVIEGIPGAPAVNFPRHLCRVGICITRLA